MDAIGFKTLITHLMSWDNDLRSQAEAMFNICCAHDPDNVALRLTQLLNSPLPDLRSMAAVLLRRHLSFSYDGEGDNGLSRLSVTTKTTLKSLLLEAIEWEESKSQSKKLCDIVSEIAVILLPEDEWPELLPYLFQFFVSGSHHIQESALLIISRLAECIGDYLLPHHTILHSVLFSSLSRSTSIDVRIAALFAFINLVPWLPSALERGCFQDLIPEMISTLGESVSPGNEADTQKALKLLIDLAGIDPDFLLPYLTEMVGSVLEIAESGFLQQSTRHLAIEFLTTFAEARGRAAGMMRKQPRFIGRLVIVLVYLLLDISDDPDWHIADIQNDDAGETEKYRVGKESLRRLAIVLGGSTMVPVVSELLPDFLTSPDWQKHHAALITLSQIAEGCYRIMIKHLEQMVTMVLKSFQHTHPRVRWAAINAIGQFSTDFGPDFQARYHQSVLPLLSLAMDDFQNPRVQAHAASVILNFTKNCTADILTPYLDGIVSKVLVLLQNGKQMVQEGALTALASIADSSKEQFKNYYDAVIPYLKAILLNATDKSNRMLWAKSMECFSLVGMAVGKDKFRDDAKQVMEVLMSLQVSQTDSDDPIASHMLQAWTRLCKCLGTDFLPYMNIVMPPLLRAAQLKADVTITSADSGDIDDSDDDCIETITIGDRRIGIRTSVLEEKVAACNMLCCYADELKEDFYPWIANVVPILVPLLEFYFQELRTAAVSAMPKLLRSAKLAVEKWVAQGLDESYFKRLSDYIFPALVDALHKEPEVEICSSMLDALNQCMQLSGHFLEEDRVGFIAETITHVVTASMSRKMERAERMKAEDFDAEDGGFLREENELEEEIFNHVGHCLRTMIKTFKTSFLPFLHELTFYLTPMWGKNRTPMERRMAVCIFNDVAEQCREAALEYYDAYLPFLLEACNDVDGDVRQASAYGIGACAEFGGSVFRPLIGEALSSLNSVIRRADALDSDNIMAYDNAVSALGKICHFHRNNIDAAQILPAWLSCLPLKGDLLEAKIVHEQLCSMVERSDDELLGPNNNNLPKILSVFVEILNAGNELATEQTISRISNLVKQLQQTTPVSFASALSSLQEHEQVVLSLVTLDLYFV